MEAEVRSKQSAEGATVDGRRLLVVCLSTQPWNVDLPTNRQQVMARIAEHGHRVLYVETGRFAGRQVVDSLSGSDGRSLRQLVTAEIGAPGVRVTTAPTFAPWGHRYRLAARINAALTTWVVRRHLKGNADPVVLWLYDPCFAGCIGRIGEQFAVYDCVDDYAEQVGEDRRKRALVSSYDGIAASRSRLVFTTAKRLAERHRSNNAKTHLVGNVGDFAHFAPAADRSIADEEVASLRRPTIGFAGNFLARKVDFALVEAVASRRPDWTVLLIGPARDDTKASLDRLVTLKNVRWLGPRAYGDLPRFIAAFDVAMIPYLRNQYTRSCFPLKTFEYLAAGKPVVASGLPELDGMKPHVVLAEDEEAFITAIETALTQRSQSDVADRQELAARNTWETRTRRLLALVTAEV
jgi:glycosyltransferase involved in cell wall biosynthesis